MAQSTAPKPDLTRQAPYQDVFDAPAQLVADVLDGTLHTQARPRQTGPATLVREDQGVSRSTS